VWVANDLDAALDAMHDVRVHPRWFRPPYGQASGATLWHAHRRGLRPVLWSAWGREWVAPTAEHVAQRVAPGLRPGAVVLLHDSDALSPPGSARRAFDALPIIAEELDRKGLVAVTLDELVAA
jgi:peptidoglycan/xylan/chitin deacetylase (PgdA/CDA1 family)